MHRIALAVFFLACTAAALPPPDTFAIGQTVGPWRVARGWVGEVDFEGETVVRGSFEKHFDSDNPCPPLAWFL